MKTGRGAWTTIGMPPNGTGYYKLLDPVRIGSEPTKDASFYAVNRGVRVIQMRLNGLGWYPRLTVDGVFGERTDVAIKFVQGVLGLPVDGRVGPRTMLALLWPVVRDYDSPIYHKTVGGLCQNESGWDPGAVGYLTPDDHGLMQINAVANPTITIDAAFHHRVAFQYANKRITEAMATYNNLDIAIASYNSPAWAAQWARENSPPNAQIQAYVERIKAWVPPS